MLKIDCRAAGQVVSVKNGMFSYGNVSSNCSDNDMRENPYYTVQRGRGRNRNVFKLRVSACANQPCYSNSETSAKIWLAVEK